MSDPCDILITIVFPRRKPIGRCLFPFPIPDAIQSLHLAFGGTPYSATNRGHAGSSTQVRILCTHVLLGGLAHLQGGPHGLYSQLVTTQDALQMSPESFPKETVEDKVEG